MKENFVDGNLLQQANKGNHEAIRAIAEITVGHLQDMANQCITGNDDITPFLVNIFESIATGQSPDEAFQWNKRGRAPQNKTFLEWNLALYVADLVNQKIERSVAIEIVGKAACMDGRKSGVVEKAYDKWKASIESGEIPSDIFPFPKDTISKLKKIDQRIKN